MTHNAQFSNGEVARAFILAGNATVTLVSGATGARFTYRIREKEMRDGKTLHFVSLLSGPNNCEDYVFLGTIFSDAAYRHGRKSRIADSAPSARAFAWCWRFLAAGDLPPNVEVWHEGRCGRCARVLTVPESIASGIGPICATR